MMIIQIYTIAKIYCEQLLNMYAQLIKVICLNKLC